MKRLSTWLFTLTTLLVIISRIAPAQSFTDPGFESYSISAGAFLKPNAGPWAFTNDASVVRPMAPNSSNGVLQTWSATFDPIEGQQYVSTYAAGDNVQQAVTFASAGNYRISVFAAEPNGSVTIPGVGTLTLVPGEFSFTLVGNNIGTLNTLALGSDWSQYSEDFIIGTPGSYLLGVRNTLVKPYFINYDNFAITLVPEPSTIMLLSLGAIGLLFARRRFAG